MHALGQWHFLPFSFFEPVPQLSPEAKRRHHHRLRGKEYEGTMRALAEWSWFYVSFARYNCVRGPFIPVSPRFNVFSTLEKSLYSRWKKNKNSLCHVVNVSFLFRSLENFSSNEIFIRFDDGSCISDCTLFVFFFFLIVTRSIGCWLDVDWSLRLCYECWMKKHFFFTDKLFRYFYKK